MAVVDGPGVPLGLQVASAQPHERTLAEPTLPTLGVAQQRGRPRTRPQALVADKADDSADFRRTLRRRGSKPTIPTLERRTRTHPQRGRPLRTGVGYRQRWQVERCFGWMDNGRRLVVRYDRQWPSYRAFCLVAIMLWCIDRIVT